jgi:hypothetical protein
MGAFLQLPVAVIGHLLMPQSIWWEDLSMNGTSCFYPTVAISVVYPQILKRKINESNKSL